MIDSMLGVLLCVVICYWHNMQHHSPAHCFHYAHLWPCCFVLLGCAGHYAHDTDILRLRQQQQQGKPATSISFKRQAAATAATSITYVCSRLSESRDSKMAHQPVLVIVTINSVQWQVNSRNAAEGRSVASQAVLPTLRPARLAHMTLTAAPSIC